MNFFPPISWVTKKLLHPSAFALASLSNFTNQCGPPVKKFAPHLFHLTELLKTPSVTASHFYGNTSPFPGTEIIYLVRSGFQWSTAHLSQSACPLPSQVQGSRREPGSLLRHRRESCPRGNPRRRRSWCPALSVDHIWSPGKGFHQRSAGSLPARLWMPVGWLRMSYTLQF